MVGEKGQRHGSRVVHKHVQGAEALEGSGNQSLLLSQIRNVRELRVKSRRRHGRSQLDEPFPVDVSSYDLSSAGK